MPPKPTPAPTVTKHKAKKVKRKGGRPPKRPEVMRIKKGLVVVTFD